jgi:hypothetical protein
MSLRKPHELRVQLLNPEGATPNDVLFMDMLAQYAPRTRLSPGDLCLLQEIPNHLIKNGPYPNVWEVRAVYSHWQYLLHRIVHLQDEFNPVLAQIETARRLSPYKYRDPIVYAHAFPHGQWPSSAEWFPEQCLKRMVLQAPVENWEPILDEFSSPFLGYDPDQFSAGVVLDLAPDIYGDQRRYTRPLSIEEDSFHQVCLLGLEEACMVPNVKEEISQFNDLIWPY